MDYAIGLLMQRTEDPVKRRLLIIVTVVVNLSFLGFFKYFNFFIDSFHAMSDAVGLGFSPSTLNITLPIGISILHVHVDELHDRRLPTRASGRAEPVKFATFIAFFPHLVAGPILRASRPVAAIARLPQDPPSAGDHRPRADPAGVFQEGRRGGRVGPGRRQDIQRAGRPFVDGPVGRRGALSRFRSTAILPATRTSPSALRACHGRRVDREFSTQPYISEELQRVLAAAGTSRSPPGSAITSTSRWAAIATARSTPIAT